MKQRKNSLRNSDFINVRSPLNISRPLPTLTRHLTIKWWERHQRGNIEQLCSQPHTERMLWTMHIWAHKIACAGPTKSLYYDSDDNDDDDAVSLYKVSKEEWSCFKVWKLFGMFAKVLMFWFYKFVHCLLISFNNNLVGDSDSCKFCT
jgi:hypothetical protein